jgi:hypothetical protein
LPAPVEKDELQALAILMAKTIEISPARVLGFRGWQMAP